MPFDLAFIWEAWRRVALVTNDWPYPWGVRFGGTELWVAPKTIKFGSNIQTIFPAGPLVSENKLPVILSSAFFSSFLDSHKFSPFTVFPFISFLIDPFDNIL